MSSQMLGSAASPREAQGTGEIRLKPTNQQTQKTRPEQRSCQSRCAHRKMLGPQPLRKCPLRPQQGDFAHRKNAAEQDGEMLGGMQLYCGPAWRFPGKLSTGHPRGRSVPADTAGSLTQSVVPHTAGSRYADEKTPSVPSEWEAL